MYKFLPFAEVVGSQRPKDDTPQGNHISLPVTVSF